MFFTAIRWSHILALDEFEWRKRPAEDALRIGVEPAIKHGCIDLTEVRGEWQVLTWCDVEAGGRSDERLLNAATHDHEGRRRSVVGSAAIVLGWAAAELGEGHGKDPVVEATGLQIALKGIHCRR